MSGGQYSVMRILTALLALSGLGPMALPVIALFAIGTFHRLSAALLSMVALATAPALSDGRMLGALVLALHAVLPAKPYGALVTRGDVDAGASWYLPGAVRSVLWLALA